MKKASITLIFTFIILYVVPLGIRPLVIPDETRYAEVAHDMLITGDWIVPKLDNLRYFEKPVLGDWLNATAFLLFGENAFAVRFPSVLAIGFSAILVFFVVRKFGGGSSSGLLTAMAFMTCFEVFGVGTFCILDSVFLMFVTATLIFFFFALQESLPLSQKNVFLTLAGISCGLAFLTKGFLAFALPVIVIIPFLIWQRQWKELLRIWWVPLIGAILVVLPWCIAIHIKEPDFWRFFFWHEHVKRFLHPDEDQHLRSFWFFIPVILIGALPWSIWLPNALLGLKSIRFKEPIIRFLVCWLVFPFMFFSASEGKLATYILPCFPPLVILIIMGFRNWYKLPGKEKIFTANQYISAVILLLVAVAFVFTQVGLFGPLKIYSSSEVWKWLLLTAALLVYAFVLVLIARQKEMNKRFIYCCLAPLALMFCVPFVIPDKFKAGKMPGAFLRRYEDRIHADTVLVSDNYLMPAVCWSYKRDGVYILGRAGEFTYGLSYPDAAGQLIMVENFPAFVLNHSTQKVALIVREKIYEEYTKKMPEPIFEEAGDGFIFAEYGPHLP